MDFLSARTSLQPVFLQTEARRVFKRHSCLLHSSIMAHMTIKKKVDKINQTLNRLPFLMCIGHYQTLNALGIWCPMVNAFLCKEENSFVPWATCISSYDNAV